MEHFNVESENSEAWSETCQIRSTYGLQKLCGTVYPSQCREEVARSTALVYYHLNHDSLHRSVPPIFPSHSHSTLTNGVLYP